MTSFMGPMAPPPAAPPQPQALDIRTDPNQRQQFKQFMRQRTSMAPMVSAPIAQPQPPMPMMQSPAMFNMGGGVDIFDPMYSAPMMAPSAPMGFKEGGSTQPIEQRVMKNGQIGLFRGQTFLGFKQEPEKKEESPLLSLAKFKEVLGFDDGGAVPPRRADIQGQDHMLSYITPDEADILKALGGSGEAGPMGIPAFPGGYGGEGMGGFGGSPGADDDDPADDMDGPVGGDTSGDMGPDSASGGSYGGSFGGGSDADEVSDALADSKAAEVAGQMADDRAADAAARDRAVRDAFATTTSGKPIGTKSGFLSKDSATDEQIAAGYKALGLPDPKSDLASADVEASYGVPTSIASVTGVPTDRLSSSNTDLLLGLPAKDLLEIENFQYAPPAQTNVSLSRNPSSFTGKVSAPFGMSPVESMARFGNPNMAGMTQSQIDNFTEQGLVTDVAPSSFTDPVANTSAVASAPPSNVVAASVDPLTQDPRTVARAMQDIQPPGIMDIGIMSNIGKGLQSLVGTLTGAPTQEEINAAYANRSPDLVGIAPGLAIAALGMEKGIPAAGMIGMTPDGKPAAITGDMLADINNRSDNLPAGLSTIGGFFNDMTLNNASASKVAVVDPVTNTVNDTQGRIVGAIDGYGRYTGNPDFNPYASPQGQGGDGPGQQVKAPTDPCPDGFVMKNGACTPIDSGSGETPPNQIGGGTPPAYVAPPVIVPSTRQTPAFTGQGPVGYGSPIAGQAAPSVASNAAMYQQMLNQQGMRPPLRLEDGGAVPPRNVEISGQGHMLSYITPDEADILKSLGGSGRLGPMGIPSFDNGDGDAYFPTFYSVPVGRGGSDQEYKRVYIGSSQDTVANRQAGSSDLASQVQDAGPGYLPTARGPDYGGGGGGGGGDGDADSMGKLGDVDPVVPDPVDPDAYNPIMDVVVPSTRLQDFPASAPPSVIGQSVPMQLQGPVGYGSPEVGQMAPSVVSNAAMYQDMLSQPFPLNFQQGGSVSSNLDMAADNFLKALMPAA